MKNLFSFLKDEDGQGMVEYGLIIGLIAIVVVAVLVTLGPKVAEKFKEIEGSIDAATTAAAG